VVDVCCLAVKSDAPDPKTKGGMID